MVALTQPVAADDAPVTNHAFIKSKLTGFVAFLKSILKKHLNNSRYAEFSKKIDELQNIDTALFIVHITTDMIPYKTNIDAYVAKLLKEHDVDSHELAAEDRARLGRYVLCFIEIVQQ